MTTLHIVNAAPAHNTQLSSCLRVLAENDAVLLCGEAVQALRSGSAAAQQLLDSEQKHHLYALEEDVQARGIDTAQLPVTLVDYPAFVGLTLEYARVMSWT